MRNGANLRITEFQAVLLTEQLKRVEEQSRTPRAECGIFDQATRGDSRHPAGAYVRRRARATPITSTCFAYDKTQFANLPRAQFLKALAAEGIPVLQRLHAAQQGAISEEHLRFARLPRDLSGKAAG